MYIHLRLTFINREDAQINTTGNYYFNAHNCRNLLTSANKRDRTLCTVTIETKIDCRKPYYQLLIIDSATGTNGTIFKDVVIHSISK